MIRLFVKFLRDESGQDLVEYGLLAAIIAIAGYLVMPTIEAKMGQAFLNWGVNVNKAWIPNDPL